MTDGGQYMTISERMDGSSPVFQKLKCPLNSNLHTYIHIYGQIEIMHAIYGIILNRVISDTLAKNINK